MLLVTFVVIVLLIATGVVTVLHSVLTEKFRYENIRGVATALEYYAEDRGEFPDIDKWCDILINEADCSPKSFQSVLNPKEGVCGYALNSNLKDIKLSELDKNIVLVFEAEGPWNLSGGPELTNGFKKKRIAVAFIGGGMSFVEKNEIDGLCWKPENKSSQESK